ncbi:hypothetical protein LXL04_001552 [Taraxacum kok-saghyz]
MVAEKHRIDCQLTCFDDVNGDGDDEGIDDGELSFDYGQIKQGVDNHATSINNPMEVDRPDIPHPQVPISEDRHVPYKLSPHLDDFVRITTGMQIQKYLQIYHNSLGKIIYMSGVGVPQDQVSMLASLTGCSAGSFPFTYLGVPIRTSMSRISGWKGMNMIDRFVSRLSSWKVKMLSIGGRLTLLKSVLGSIGLPYTWKWRFLNEPSSGPSTVFMTKMWLLRLLCAVSWEMVILFAFVRGGLESSHFDALMDLLQPITLTSSLMGGGGLSNLRETLSHLLFACPTAVQVWQKVTVWVQCPVPAFTSMVDLVEWVDARPAMGQKRSIVDSIFMKSDQKRRQNANVHKLPKAVGQTAKLPKNRQNYQGQPGALPLGTRRRLPPRTPLSVAAAPEPPQYASIQTNSNKRALRTIRTCSMFIMKHLVTKANPIALKSYW